jgi:pimeloyl-ACP methyl ester carboxylesterase
VLPAEEKIEVETPLGPIWFWRRDSGRPVLLVITGAFATFGVLEGLGPALEGVDVWRAHLPGNHSPPLTTTSVGAFAAAFRHAIRAQLEDRPLVVMGLSVGALTALGLRAPNIRRLVLVEPPLLTEGLWMLRLVFEQAPAGSEDFLWNILGVAADRTEPRSYTALLDELATPTLALLGEEPVGRPRDFEVMPSMVTEAARAALAAHPQVELATAPGAGHNVPKLAPLLLLKAARRSCEAAFFRPS